MNTLYIVKCENNGRILQTSSIQGSSLLIDASEIIISYEDYVEINSNPSMYYYDSNVLTRKPTKPEGSYIFDYSLKKWVFDYEKAVIESLKKRDALLAEGPDRINPMWWASMTEQEQQAWTFYRQALLDITGQADYPEFIVWPIKP